MKTTRVHSASQNASDNRVIADIQKCILEIGMIVHLYCSWLREKCGELKSGCFCRVYFSLGVSRAKQLRSWLLFVKICNKSSGAMEYTENNGDSFLLEYCLCWICHPPPYDHTHIHTTYKHTFTASRFVTIYKISLSTLQTDFISGYMTFIPIYFLQFVIFADILSSLLQIRTFGLF